MKYFSKLIFYGMLIFALTSFRPPSISAIAIGKQPQISTDNTGIIRVVYGSNDSIFCITSVNAGQAFGKPALVGIVKKMHLGMDRGPQLASSAHYSIVTAMDQTGNIHFFVLNHKNSVWQNKGLVNDIEGSAPEGLMNIACDRQDNFYATWLDLRLNKKNNIYFSTLQSGHDKWARNTLVYRSPDEHVCECCRPSIAVKGPNVAIMFRNWLNGSRDLYLATSTNNGHSFNNAVKLGGGTWKLNACPMDGGGLNFNADNTINTTWQRQGVVYYYKPGQNETEVGKGRDCSISTGQNQTIVALVTDGVLKYKNIRTNAETIVGKGSYLKILILPDNKVVCIWEEDGHISSRVI
jgi:hypothetical protein